MVARSIITPRLDHTTPCTEAPRLVVAVSTVLAAHTAWNEALFLVFILITLATADTLTALVVILKGDGIVIHLAPRARRIVRVARAI